MREFDPPARRTLPSRYLISSPVPPRHARWTAPLRRRPGAAGCALALLLLLPAAVGTALTAPYGLQAWVSHARGAGGQLLLSGHGRDRRRSRSAAPALPAGPATRSSTGPAADPVTTPAPDPGPASGAGPAPGRDGTGEFVLLPGEGSTRGTAPPDRPVLDGTVRPGRRPVAGASAGRGGAAGPARPAASTQVTAAPGKDGRAGTTGGATKAGRGANAGNTANTEVGAAGWADAECRRRFPGDATRRAACAAALTGALGG